MQMLKGTNSNDPNYTTLSQKQKSIKDNLKTAEDSLVCIEPPGPANTINR